MKATKPEQLYRLEGPAHTAGLGEVLTLKQWKRIYGREPGCGFIGKLVPVTEPAKATPAPSGI